MSQGSEESEPAARDAVEALRPARGRLEDAKYHLDQLAGTTSKQAVHAELAAFLNATYSVLESIQEQSKRALRHAGRANRCKRVTTWVQDKERAIHRDPLLQWAAARRTGETHKGRLQLQYHWKMPMLDMGDPEKGHGPSMGRMHVLMSSDSTDTAGTVSNMEGRPLSFFIRDLPATHLGQPVVEHDWQALIPVYEWYERTMQEAEARLADWLQ